MSYRNGSVVLTAALAALGVVAGGWAPVAAQSAAAPEVNFQAGFGAIVKRVQPAVVSVMSTTNGRRVETRIFGGGNIPFEIPQGPRQGLGSGVIVSADGYIVTNNHVVDGADTVRVSLQDSREFTAKVVGKDADTDVAVLKIEMGGLPHVEFGNSDSVQVGDLVLAMGNPFGVGQTVTMGIVGATHRNTPEAIEKYEDFIQTDAAINPGNSGGALVSMKGELIGINTAIISRTGGNNGVGFAIPAKTARNVMDQLVKYGKVSRGRMGVTIQGVNAAIAKQFGWSGTNGALVSDVESGSPAERAGVKTGDIITEVNGSRIADSADLRVRIAALAPGTAAKLKVFREGKDVDVSVTLGSQPGQEAASKGGGPASGDGPRLGVTVEPASRSGRNRTAGLVITDVGQGSAAEEAGLRPGDVILEVNRKAVSDPAEFQRMVRGSANEALLLYVESGSDRGAQKGSMRRYVTVQPR